MPTHQTPERYRSYLDLVFEGGGVRGIALVGALSMLEEHGFEPQNIAGTSAGAIVATLLAAGYTAGELSSILEQMDFASFRDTAWEDKVPVVGTPLSIIKDLGIYEGEAFLIFIRELLAQKGVHTFRDLIHPAFAHDPRYRYRVQIIASDISTRRLLVLPQHARHLGIEPDDLDVALAVRMSSSIPIFFEPVRHLNPKTGEEHLIVDGGMLSNFPIWLFDSDGAPEWPTFGLRLVESPATEIAQQLSPPPQPSGAPGIVDFVKSMVETMMSAHDRLYIDTADYARTIAIPTVGTRTTDFELSREQVLQLYESGRRAATAFLETWDFESYIAEFRMGKTHSRRQYIAALAREARAERQGQASGSAGSDRGV